jgi:hypothetical protein
MSIKDMINHAHNKDANSFETAFADVMAGKVEAALGAKFDDMFGDTADEVEVEDVAIEAEVDEEDSVEQPDSEVE